MPKGGEALKHRVLVLPPTAKDGERTSRVFREAGIECLLCSTLLQLCEEACLGVGAVFIPQEVIDAEDLSSLTDFLRAEPAWSDVPILVLTNPRFGLASLARVLDLPGQIVLVQRPVWIAGLLSLVRAALQTRRRQYETGLLLDQLAQNESRLRDANYRKDEFLAMLGHELRNPLAPIRNAVAVLQIAETEPTQIRWAREIIGRQATHLSRLVDDLLDVSRISSGKVTLKSEDLDLGEVVSQAVEACRSMADEKSHSISLNVSGKLKVRGDPTRLGQIFVNLINNAVKYTDPGGQIEVVVHPDQEFAVFAIRDNGLGIGPELLPYVFDLFTQSERTLDRAQGGLGLGLTLVKRLTEMHGGTIDVASEGLGKGSIFTVRLPLLNIEQFTSDKELNTQKGPSSTQSSLVRVLVVDDNQDSASSLALLLKFSGHLVETASAGQQALETAIQFRPDAILLDIGLPDIDGYEVARRLRAHDEISKSLIIALTGYGSEEARVACRDAGFDAHLVKPPAIETILELIATRSAL